MGLIITSEINTDGGSTQSAYINISKFDFIKNRGARVSTNLYLNKEARDANELDTISSKTIAQRFGVDREELISDSLYSSIYAKIRLTLEQAGLTVEDDI
jgi:hypothetical protein